MNDEVRAAYGEKHFQMRTKSMIKYLETGYQDVQPVIEAYTNALIDVFPQQRYLYDNILLRSEVTLPPLKIVYLSSFMVVTKPILGVNFFLGGGGACPLDPRPGFTLVQNTSKMNGRNGWRCL